MRDFVPVRTFPGVIQSEAKNPGSSPRPQSGEADARPRAAGEGRNFRGSECAFRIH
jgi:hypothetical protein